MMDQDAADEPIGPIISIGREEVVLDNLNSRETSQGRRSHGFHLVRSKWDPYPWIRSVETGSSAEISGLKSGDCLLEIDGRDVLGLEMKDIAYLIGRSERVSLGIWRRPAKSPHQAGDAPLASLEEKSSREPGEIRTDQTGTLLEGPLPEVAQRLVLAVSGVVKALECPVCLESASPPVSQCVHGHLLCSGCRPKAARCPVCRVRLGQGRCLLADKSHRALADALLEPEQQLELQAGGRSLRDGIFGAAGPAAGRKQHHRFFGQKGPARQLLSRMLMSKHQQQQQQQQHQRRGVQDERNASTESLPTGATCAMDGNLLYGRRWLLRLYDRRKSASTGELNNHGREASPADSPAESPAEGSLAELNSPSYLSVPQTPVWGGSMESMTSGRLCCPWRERTGCREPINLENLVDHLSAQHPGPLVHFYNKKITLPFPLPFQDALYIMHHKGEIFVVQYDNGKLWLSNPESNCGICWEWILHGTTEEGSEIQLRKEVISLREPFELLPYHVAVLPDNFSASSVDISLIELDVDEGCVKV